MFNYNHCKLRNLKFFGDVVTYWNVYNNKKEKELKEVIVKMKSEKWYLIVHWNKICIVDNFAVYNTK